MTGVIYSATNQLNGKVYVGQTTSKLNKRIRNHYHYAACAAYSHKPHFINAILKYNKEDWLWEILEIVEAQNKQDLIKLLNKFEEYYIRIYDAQDFKCGYNIEPGGKNNAISETTRNKMSVAHKGIPCSEEAKIKIGNAHRGKSNWWKGRPKSEAQKQKMREAALKRYSIGPE